jgi:hypothetical protein
MPLIDMRRAQRAQVIRAMREESAPMSVRISDVRDVTKPIASKIRNAYIDFSKMTTSLVAVVRDVVRDGRLMVDQGFDSSGHCGQGGIKASQACCTAATTCRDCDAGIPDQSAMQTSKFGFSDHVE